MMSMGRACISITDVAFGAEADMHGRGALIASLACEPNRTLDHRLLGTTLDVRACAMYEEWLY
jgi:hypothetical protein